MANPNVPNKSTDSGFFAQLTLDLSKVLNNTPRVTNVSFEKRQPTERSQVMTWEQRHNVYLPEDMKRLYLSTDGFSLIWSYQYSPNDVRRVGYFNIPQLLQITLLRENLDTLQGSVQQLGTSSSATSKLPTDRRPLPNISGRTKIFEMSNICDLGKVCLVYESLDLSKLKVYLLETRTLKFTFLADSFSEYLRMTIVHLGLPYWELCFSSCGLPPWAEQLFLLLAPHLLEKSEPRQWIYTESGKRAAHIQTGVEADKATHNILDPTIFRVKVKSSTNISTTSNKKPPT